MEKACRDGHISLEDLAASMSESYRGLRGIWQIEGLLHYQRGDSCTNMTWVAYGDNSGKNVAELDLWR